MAGVPVPAVPWWMGFVVLTIAGERLELSRFGPASPRARAAFAVIVAVMVIGLVGTLRSPPADAPLFAVALLALALWLMRQDIARRTVRQSGLTRYIAVCLLGGYVWLALAGALGAAGGFAAGDTLRDGALHAVFLGFVVSMIFGHAPIILPAVARVRLAYSPAFYGPLALLHLSVLARVAGDLSGAAHLVQWAAIGNGASLLLFVLTTVVAILRRGSAPA